MQWAELWKASCSQRAATPALHSDTTEIWQTSETEIWQISETEIWQTSETDIWQTWAKTLEYEHRPNYTHPYPLL